MTERPELSAGPPPSVLEAAAKVVAEQTREMRHQGKHLRRTGDPEAVHDLRVATRRLRTALRSVREHVASPKPLRGELRRLARRLGRVRDHDVMLERLGGMRLAGASRDERARLARLVGKLQDRRARARTDLVTALRRKRYRGLLDRLDDFADQPRAAHGDFTLATRVLAEESERLGAAVAKSAGMTVADPSPRALHALRIAFKRLRYALDFHASACGLAYDVERRLARGMQDVLGEIHDRDLLLGWLAQGKGPFHGPWPVLTRRLTAERSRLLRRFRRLRSEWTRRTRPEPQVAPLEPPRFVNLEVQPVTLRLVTGPRVVASVVRGG
jgi:CHAD domain-containing protein